MDTLKSVNNRVNRAIAPRGDRRDEWAINVSSGDCEDYALTKRAALIRGLPEMPVENIRLENVRMSARSGIYIADAANVSFNDVHVLVEKGPALAIRDSAKIETRAVSLKNKEGALATVRGDRSSAIDLSGTDTTANAIAISAEVPASAIIKP